MKAEMKPKKFTLIFLLATLFSCGGLAQRNGSPTMTKTFELDRAGTLNASSSGGGIVVETHNQKNVEIQVFVRKNGKVLSESDPDVNEVLDMYDLEIEKNGTAITAIARRKVRSGFFNNSGISFTIITPREMSCDVSSSGGGLKISGVSGTHKFSSSGGGVQLENTSGITSAKSSGGSVKATNHNGDIQLRSSGGKVSLEDAHGNVSAHSSGGGVYLSDIHGDVEAVSSGGGVSVTGEAGSVDAKSSGGPVKVDIRNLKKELHLTSSGGGVDAVIHGGDKLGLDLDLSSGKVNIDLHNFSGKAEKNRVSGKMNNGGIPVYMRASGGSVNVDFEN